MALYSRVGLFGIRMPEAPDPDQGKISEALRREFYSDDLHSRRNAVAKIGKIQDAKPIIDSGLVPDIVSLLESEDAYLQYEALCIVKTITYEANQKTNVAVEAGAIPKLIRLSASPREDVSVNAVSALANLVGDSPSLRDRVEEAGGIDAFLRLLNCTVTIPTRTQRRAVLAISNYLVPWPSDKLSVLKTKPLVPCLARYINETLLDKTTAETNKESIASAIQSLSRILDHGLKRSEIIETGVIPRLVQILVDPSSSKTLQRRASRCISYFLVDDEGADALIDAGLLPALLALIEGKNQDLCQMALYNAANIAKRNQSQIHAFLDCGLLKPVVRILMDDQRPTPCRREACRALEKLSKKVSVDSKVGQAFMEGGGVASLSAALLIRDQQTKERAVTGVTNLLEGQDAEGFQNRASLLAAIRSSSGPQNLRAIRYSRGSGDRELREACRTVLTHYFPEYSKRARV